jgi:hypothetical protein
MLYDVKKGVRFLLFLLPGALQAQTFTEVAASAGVNDAGSG